MADKEESGPKLSEIFSDIWKSYEFLDSTNEAVNSEKVQVWILNLTSPASNNWRRKWPCHDFQVEVHVISMLTERSKSCHKEERESSIHGQHAGLVQQQWGLWGGHNIRNKVRLPLTQCRFQPLCVTEVSGCRYILLSALLGYFTGKDLSKDRLQVIKKSQVNVTVRKISNNLCK